MRNWIAPAAILAFSGSIYADTVISATGSFSAFQSGFASSTPTWISNATPPATTGAPFWNDPSDDTGVGGSHLMNVGYLLTDTGGFAGTPSVLGTDTVTQSFTAGGADPMAFNFVRNAAAYNISLLFADSGLDTGTASVGTVFGYYVGSTLTPLYTVGLTNSPTPAHAFNPTTPGTSYGFYATVCYLAGSCETYTTGAGNSGNNTGGAAWNHFALFQLASGSYVIGFTGQNGIFGENLGDFQDVVVELQVTPEPGTIAMIGLGFAGIAFLRRRS
jgi:hypothetical protein